MEKNKIKRFNENSELNISDVRSSKINESKDPDIRVKDIINFLKSFDPETPVYLDKDGWQTYGEDLSNDDIIRYLIDDSAITRRGKNYLMINN